MNRTFHMIVLSGVSLLAAGLSGCSTPLRVVAESDDLQWTGVALDKSGDMYVNYPRWSDRYEMAVAKLGGGARDSTRARPYPDARWNTWVEPSRVEPSGSEPGRVEPSGSEPRGAEPVDAETSRGGWRDRFVAVQSVHVDRQDRLWVLDTGRVSRSAGRQAAVYAIDTETDEVVRTTVLPFEVAPEGSYINDIRLTPDGAWAFISDSGLGAIIVLETGSGAVRRVLADHPSTKGSAERTPVVEGRPWLVQATGEPNVVHCDGIAVSPDGRWVYYQAISADTLYRVPVAALVDAQLSASELAANVQNLGTSVVTDGMIFDDAGNLYFSALEEDAIIYRTPTGSYETLVQDPRISWPDSFAIDRERGLLLFTTAQIHRTPRFSVDGSWPSEPYRVWSHALAQPASE